MKGGNLQVTHNLPQTKVEITVNMDATKVAKSIATAEIGKGSTTKYFQASEEFDKTVGF